MIIRRTAKPDDLAARMVAGTGPGSAAAIRPASNTSLATLLASHILRDGELVLLILKPSAWFIFLSSLRFITAVLILMIAVRINDDHLPGPNRAYVEAGASIIAARLMWATLQWMGRLYILTDLRIVSVVGVFTIEVFSCPLRKVARTRLVYTMSELLLRAGSIEIIPQDENQPFGIWQTIAKPRQVHEQVLATIARAKQGGCG